MVQCKFSVEVIIKRLVIGCYMSQDEQDMGFFQATVLLLKAFGVKKPNDNLVLKLRPSLERSPFLVHQAPYCLQLTYHMYSRKGSDITSPIYVYKLVLR